MNNFRSDHTPEDNINTDRYMITYADLITLLLGLFVILYVTSRVDDLKYKEFSKAFSEYFKTSNAEVLQGSNGLMNGHRKSIPEPVFQYPAKKSLQDVQNRLENSFREKISQNLFSVTKTGEGLLLVLPEKLLFKSGNADIETGASEVLDSLAVIFEGLDKLITIDGHTDSKPINSFRYPSNWHLSVARALNVGYELMNRGIQQNHFVIRGFGAQRPVADNFTPTGQAQNRRVEILISDMPSNAPSTSGYNAESNK